MPQSLTPLLLPHSATTDKIFFQTSIFHQNRTATLPSPDTVRNLSGDFSSQPEPVKVECIGLLVKFDHHVTVEETFNVCVVRKPLVELYVPEVNYLAERWK